MKSKRTPPSDLETITPILIGAWRRMLKESGPADKLQTREFRRVVSLIKEMQQHLSSESSLGNTYFETPDNLGAYLLYHWIIHYQQGLSLIGELPQAPGRVLDVCSGPGAFAFAAMRYGAHDVVAIDKSERALQLGAEVCGRYGYPLSARTWNALKERLPVEGQFDLIIVGHCLSELFPPKSKNSQQNQCDFIKSLLDRLTPDGYLMIVDSSHSEANRRILQLRDTLVQDGVPVQAPCVWKGPCPAVQIHNSPCYAQREMEKNFLIKEFQRAAQINLGSLKMTYIIFRNPQAAWPSLPSKEVFRIISPPIDTFQGKRYYLCGNEGKKNLGSHLTTHPIESRAFEYLKRGELISLEGAMEKQQALDIVEGTKVILHAACGKPIPQ